MRPALQLQQSHDIVHTILILKSYRSPWPEIGVKLDLLKVMKYIYIYIYIDEYHLIFAPQMLVFCDPNILTKECNK